METLIFILLMLIIQPFMAVDSSVFNIKQSMTAESALKDFRDRDDLIDSVLEVNPRTSYWISYYRNDNYDKVLNFEGVIYGRYKLYGSTPINLDAKGRILSRGEARFSIAEIERVELLPTKQVSIWHGESRRDISEKEWWDIYRSGGDLGILGIDLIKDSPIEGVELIRSEREYESRSSPAPN